MKIIVNWRRCALVGAFLFFVAMIAIGSIPNEANTLAQWIPDKVSHSVAYGLLAALTYAGQEPLRKFRGLLTITAIAVLGALDETIQSLFTYRTSSIADWLFDVSAALVVVALLSRFKAREVYVPKVFDKASNR